MASSDDSVASDRELLQRILANQSKNHDESMSQMATRSNQLQMMATQEQHTALLEDTNARVRSMEFRQLKLEAFINLILQIGIEHITQPITAKQILDSAYKRAAEALEVFKSKSNVAPDDPRSVVIQRLNKMKINPAVKEHTDDRRHVDFKALAIQYAPALARKHGIEGIIEDTVEAKVEDESKVEGADGIIEDTVEAKIEDESKVEGAEIIIEDTVEAKVEVESNADDFLTPSEGDSEDDELGASGRSEEFRALLQQQASETRAREIALAARLADRKRKESESTRRLADLSGVETIEDLMVRIYDLETSYTKDDPDLHGVVMRALEVANAKLDALRDAEDSKDDEAAPASTPQPPPVRDSVWTVMRDGQPVTFKENGREVDLASVITKLPFEIAAGGGGDDDGGDDGGDGGGGDDDEVPQGPPQLLDTSQIRERCFKVMVRKHQNPWYSELTPVGYPVEMDPLYMRGYDSAGIVIKMVLHVGGMDVFGSIASTWQLRYGHDPDNVPHIGCKSSWCIKNFVRFMPILDSFVASDADVKAIDDITKYGKAVFERLATNFCKRGGVEKEMPRYQKMNMEAMETRVPTKLQQAYRGRRQDLYFSSIASSLVIAVAMKVHNEIGCLGQQRYLQLDVVRSFLYHDIGFYERLQRLSRVRDFLDMYGRRAREDIGTPWIIDKAPEASSS